MYKRIWPALLCALIACKETPPPLPVEVVTSPAESSHFPIYGDFVATTRASLDVEVRARVNGFIEEVAFTEGSRVQAGDLLYRIDDRPYKARVNRLTAGVENAEALLHKTQRDVDRLEPLFKQDAASQMDLDNALAARDQAKAGLAAAQAELKEATLELEYTQVTAPINGLVGATQADLGALVGSNGQSLLTTVKKVDPMYVQFHMSALDYLNARRRKSSFDDQQKLETEGKAVEGYVQITLPDDSRYRYWGDVNFTDPQVNPRTGTFAVRAVIPNPDRELLPGQYVRARLELDAIADAVVIHEKAIQVEQGGTFVMVAMPDNTAERRFIVTGPRSEDRVVVNSGLAAGEQIIVEGIHKVRHGQSIRTISAEAYAERLREQEAELVKAEAAAAGQEETPDDQAPGQTDEAARDQPEGDTQP